jgi:menaquinone-dependent protoporphyrinogen oxidase
MSRILIAFASIDGHAARIAARIAATLVRAGHDVDARSIDSPGLAQAIGASDAVIVGAAIRFGRHVRNVEARVHDHAAAISTRPNAFFSVSLSGGGPGARPETAQGYVVTFCERSGWHPRGTAIFGGALCYSRYNAFIRFMMRLIVGFAGGDTDTSRDYDYTDWRAVGRFAVEFAASLEPRVPVAPRQARRFANVG